MQAAYDVELGYGFGVAVACYFPHLFQRHGVGLGVLGSLAEGAQAATGYADIRGIDVAVYVEVGYVLVFALADLVG